MIKPVTLSEDELNTIIKENTCYDQMGNAIRTRPVWISSKTKSRIWFLNQGLYITRVVNDSNGNRVYRRCKGRHTSGVQPTLVEPFNIRLFNKIWKVKQIEKPNLKCSTNHPYIRNPIKEEDYTGTYWTPCVEDRTREFTLDFVIVSLVGPVKGKDLQEQLTLWN